MQLWIIFFWIVAAFQVGLVIATLSGTSALSGAESLSVHAELFIAQAILVVGK